MKTNPLTTLLATALLAFVSATAMAQESRWLTDFSKAQEKAKAENKAVLLDFTGSDWCGWCIKMNDEVLKTKAFKEYAAKNLVLVEVDFPNSKHQTKKVKEQNEGLKNQYKANGFPTFVLVDKEGKELGRQVGYLQGGPDAFVAKLDSFKK